MGVVGHLELVLDEDCSASGLVAADQVEAETVDRVFGGVEDELHAEQSLRTSTFLRSQGVKSSASCGHTSRGRTGVRRPRTTGLPVITRPPCHEQGLAFPVPRKVVPGFRHAHRMTTPDPSDTLADWSDWSPFVGAVAAAPKEPGVYMAKDDSQVVYVGMAAERRGQGIKGRLTVLPARARRSIRTRGGGHGPCPARP